jgi:hypothetical protein
MRFPILAAAVFSIFLAQGDASLRIDSPSEKDSVSGTVEIRGTAAAPGMTRYRVDFAYQQNPTNTWFSIAESTEPVQNGVLAEWGTALVSEGTYSLRLSAYLQDGSVRSVTVGGVRVTRGAALLPSPSGEFVIHFQPDAQTSGRAAAFPAPTANFVPESLQAARAAPGRASLFLAGAVLALLAFGLAGLRFLWKRWRHHQFVLRARKNENNHG